jgi:hypothetical protein
VRKNWSGNPNKFWFRVVASTMLFASIFALGGVTYGTIKTLSVQSSLKQEDGPVELELGRNIYEPVEQRIDRHEQLIAKLKNPVTIRQERRKLAVFYEELGNQSLDENNLVRAEQSYLTACSLDPDTLEYATKVATVYEKSAEREPSLKQKISLLQNSVSYWREAAEKERDHNLRMDYAGDTTRVMLRLCEALAKDGQTFEAKQELERAKSAAPPGVDYTEEVAKLSHELDGDINDLNRMDR